MAWTFLTSGTELQPVRIDGVNVWDHKWQESGRKAEVTDPRRGQSFTFEVWSIATKKKSIQFAAGEFSNGIWGFYTEAL